MGQSNSYMGKLNLEVPIDAQATAHIFAQYDRDDDGRLTGDEIDRFVSDWCRVHRTTQETEVRNLLMKNFDANGDGALTKVELMSMVKSSEAKSGGGLPVPRPGSIWQGNGRHIPCAIDPDRRRGFMYVQFANENDYNAVCAWHGQATLQYQAYPPFNMAVPPISSDNRTRTVLLGPLNVGAGVAAGAGVTFFAPGDTQTGFNVKAQGAGTFQGLSYTIPAHTKGTLKAKIQTLSLTSNDVKTLRGLVKTLVDASKWQKIEEEEKTHASADISFLAIFSGGATASYDQTKKEMSGFGLSADQQKVIVEKMMELALKMSSVELNFEIDNLANDYSVSGNLQLYTIAGEITTEQGTKEYRVLSDRGVGGQVPDTAPAAGEILS